MPNKNNPQFPSNASNQSKDCGVICVQMQRGKVTEIPKVQIPEKYKYRNEVLVLSFILCNDHRFLVQTPPIRQCDHINNKLYCGLLQMQSDLSLEKHLVCELLLCAPSFFTATHQTAPADPTDGTNDSLMTAIICSSASFSLNITLLFFSCNWLLNTSLKVKCKKQGNLIDLEKN